MCVAEQEGVLQTADNITQVPATIVALSLHAMGLTLVRSRDFLGCLRPVLTEAAYLKCLTVSLLIVFSGFQIPPESARAQSDFLRGLN